MCRSALATSKRIKIERGICSRVIQDWQGQPLAGPMPQDSVSSGFPPGLEALLKRCDSEG